jgi:hypothetical protein
MLILYCTEEKSMNMVYGTQSLRAVMAGGHPENVKMYDYHKDLLADEITTSNRKFVLQIGSHTEFRRHKYHFTQFIEETFSKQPKIRAKILQGLYVSGKFSEWVEGYGLITAIDAEGFDEAEGRIIL